VFLCSTSAQSLFVQMSEVSPSSVLKSDDCEGGAPSITIALEHEWVIYFDERQRKGLDRNTFNKSTNKLGEFCTVQGFWRYWNNLDVSKLPSNSNLRLFKKSINPSWEDPANVNGGKWAISVSREDTAQFWLNCVLTLIGEQFQHSKDLCGVVLAIRGQGNNIQLWNTDANADKQLLLQTELELRSCLKLNKDSPIRYIAHSATLDYNNLNRRNDRNSYKQTRGSTQSDDAPFTSPFIELTDMQDGNAAYPDENSTDSPKIRHRKSPSHSRVSVYKPDYTTSLKHRKSLSHSENWKPKATTPTTSSGTLTVSDDIRSPLSNSTPSPDTDSKHKRTPSNSRKNRRRARRLSHSQNFSKNKRSSTDTTKVLRKSSSMTGLHQAGKLIKNKYSRNAKSGHSLRCKVLFFTVLMLAILSVIWALYTIRGITFQV